MVRFRSCRAAGRAVLVLDRVASLCAVPCWIVSRCIVMCGIASYCVDYGYSGFAWVSLGLCLGFTCGLHFGAPLGLCLRFAWASLGLRLGFLLSGLTWTSLGLHLGSS